MPKAELANPKKSARKAVDWEAVERDYRAGLKSLREIGIGHGVTHGAIRKRAGRDGWDRDLSARIKAKAESLVSKAEVPTTVSTDTAAEEKAIVEANATAIMRVRLEHRKDIARARTLAMDLLAELEQTAEAAPLIERLEALVAADAGLDGAIVLKRQQQLVKVLELGNRTATMKMLADTMTKLIGLEREAYSLKTDAKDPDEDGGAGSIRALLAAIDGAGTGLPSHAGQPAA